VPDGPEDVLARGGRGGGPLLPPLVVKNLCTGRKKGESTKTRQCTPFKGRDHSNLAPMNILANGFVKMSDTI